jgi:hypothetical protein
MIRVLLGSVLALAGLGTAVASFGPDLLAGPRGEPIVMAVPGDNGFQPASFNEGGCGSSLLLANPDDFGLPSFDSQINAFTLSVDGEHTAIVFGDLVDAATASETMVLIFDSDGRLVSAGDRTLLDAAFGDCLADPEMSKAPI